MSPLRRVAAIGWLGLACVAIGGCGAAETPSMATLESQVSGILRLKSVSLQRGDASIEGDGVADGEVRYQLTIKRTSENEPLWFFADDAFGNRIMGSCDESPPQLAIAEVLKLADQQLPGSASGAPRFNVIIRDGVWDVARASPDIEGGGAAVHITDDDAQAEIYYRLAEVG